MKFTAVLLQVDTQDDKDANLEKVSHMINEAAGKHADLVAMPEFVNYIGGRRGFIENAEDIPGGETSQLFSRKAREHHIWIHGGSIAERIPDDDSRVYNTTCVFSPKDELAALCHMVVDPYGNMIAQAGDRECVLTAEVDTDYVMRLREMRPVLKHRRPDVYGCTG